MSDITDKQIVAKVRRKAKTAPELGVSIQRLRRLEQQGALVRVGTRINGRGRPAIVFTATA